MPYEAIGIKTFLEAEIDLHSLLRRDKIKFEKDIFIFLSASLNLFMRLVNQYALFITYTSYSIHHKSHCIQYLQRMSRVNKARLSSIIMHDMNTLERQAH